VWDPTEAPAMTSVNSSSKHPPVGAHNRDWVPGMCQLLELGIWQVAANDVGHVLRVQVVLKPAPMQQHELLELCVRGLRVAVDKDGDAPEDVRFCNNPHLEGVGFKLQRRSRSDTGTAGVR
jgi:hypothetical protein